MIIALFGGTFDPIHRGQLAVAHAAAEKFHLDVVHFVLADVPPHKQTQPITSYQHRFAMLELALTGIKGFVASRIEERKPGEDATPNYSINTVRLFKKTLKPEDKLFFIVGMDSFLGISKWKDPAALLSECEFIVASRPGHSLQELASVLPDPKLAGRVHLIETVAEDVSSTQIRQAAGNVEELEHWVPPAVASYIREHSLYR